VKTLKQLKEDANNPQDVLKISIPLFIRLLEYSREDAKSDVDLHKVAERAISMQSKILTTDDYNLLVK